VTSQTLTMGPRVSACVVGEFPHGTPLRTLLVHQKLALEISCCTTAHILWYVRNQLPCWQ